MKNAMMFVAGLTLVLLVGCGDSPLAPDAAKSLQTQPVERKLGTVIMLIIDDSGSMTEKPATGGSETKTDIATRSAMNVSKKIEDFARDHPDRQVQFGIMMFSNQSTLIAPIAPPNHEATRKALENLGRGGGTAIGDAIFSSKLLLSATGFSDKNIIVITDGKNNSGASPDSVAKAIFELPVDDKASLFLIGFDVDTSAYDSMKPYSTILSANDAAQLNTSLDFVLDKKILLEKE